MTLAEFKAWFEGFTEGFGGAPSDAQWTRIKARVKEIDGTAITQTVFVDRYWPTYYREYRPYYSGTPLGGSLSGMSVQSQSGSLSGMQVSNTAGFNSYDAMQALGRNDFQTLNAA